MLSHSCKNHVNTILLSMLKCSESDRKTYAAPTSEAFDTASRRCVSGAFLGNSVRELPSSTCGPTLPSLADTVVKSKLEPEASCDTFRPPRASLSSVGGDAQSVGGDQQQTSIGGAPALSKAAVPRRRKPSPGCLAPSALPRLKLPLRSTQTPRRALSATPARAIAMETFEDSNFNCLQPKVDCVSSMSTMSPVARKRDLALPSQTEGSPNVTLAGTPRRKSLYGSPNNNYSSPQRRCASPAGTGVNAQGSLRSCEVTQPWPTMNGDEISSSDVSFEENLNRPPQPRARGKALIIRRASPVNSTASLRVPAPVVRSGGFKDSEAGPEVALLPEDFYGPAAAFFQDTAAVDVLTGTIHGPPTPTGERDSLLLRCDPRLRHRPSPASLSPEKARRRRTQQDESAPVSEKQLSLTKEELITFSPPSASDKRRRQPPAAAGSGKREPPPDVAPPAPVSAPMAPAASPSPAASPALSRASTASRTEAGSDNKAQELALQEQLLKRDREVQTLQETVSKLKQQLATSQSAQQRLSKVVELHTSGLARLAASQCQLESQMNQQSQRLSAERDEARDEVANIETMFADLHRKYEKSKTLLAESRQATELMTSELDGALQQVSREQQRYDMLQQYAEDTMQRLQADMVLEQKSQEKESLRLSARLQLAENRATKLERENEEVTAICDELIQKMGGDR